MKLLGRIAALALALAPCAAQAAAPDYPNRPVRVIIAFPPGSATDIIGRIITQRVTEAWGQNVLPDNRGGAGGSIASAIAAKAAPDGYTLIINSGAHTVAPAMFAKLPYDTAKDFTDVLPLVAMPNVLVVNPGSKLRSLGDFLTEARNNPGKINFAFAGLGSGTHLNNEKFKLAAKIDFTNVAYKGSGEVFPDLLGGRVDTYFAPLSAGKPYIDGGKLRPLAVTSAKRAPQLPNVPTIAESGVPKFEFLLWFGLWGPSGMPQPVVSKIRTVFAQALADPGVKERLSTQGTAVMNLTPAQFGKFVDEEISVSAALFKAAGIQPQ
jgi:tripartite-type tricarboxylate transporter receptor subunit TctC